MSTKHLPSSPGFTIVELLIVIVVIGILAAITLVAFSGVRDRANDSSVRADLSNNMKQLQAIAVDSGFPSSTPAVSVGLRFSKSAYWTANNNVYYCSSTDGVSGAIAARSASGKAFIYSTTTGLQDYTGAWGGSNACGSVGMTMRAHGYDAASNTWYTWTN